MTVVVAAPVPGLALAVTNLAAPRARLGRARARDDSRGAVWEGGRSRCSRRPPRRARAKRGSSRRATTLSARRMRRSSRETRRKRRPFPRRAAPRPLPERARRDGRRAPRVRATDPPRAPASSSERSSSSRTSARARERHADARGRGRAVAARRVRLHPRLGRGAGRVGRVALRRVPPLRRVRGQVAHDRRERGARAQAQLLLSCAGLVVAAVVFGVGVEDDPVCAGA